MLLDATRSHVPVLAGELIDLAAPAEGETAVDCTFGAGGHAPRSRAAGAHGDVDLHRSRPRRGGRFEELARDALCSTRFLRMNYADGLELLLAGELRRRPRIPRSRALLASGGHA